MPSEERVMAVVTLSLLNVFSGVAGLSLVVQHPEHLIPPRAPSVADRTVVATARPVLPGLPKPAPLPSANGLAAGLASPLAAPGLGPSVAASIADPKTGRSLFASRADIPATPASTTKLITSVAALAALGPDRRLTTKVVQSGRRVVLVGGGDPTLAGPAASPRAGYPQPASIATLAKRAAAALRGTGTAVQVDYDASLYSGPPTGPGWKPNYIPEGNVAPVTALQIDAGRVSPTSRDRVSDPPRTAAQAFVSLLGRYGVTATLGGQTRAAGTGRQLAAVQSPPVSALVEHLLTDSDNDVAEAMARHVAIAKGGPASFAGGSAAVARTLTELGVAQGVQVYDGSGLSTKNRITAAGLVRVLSLAASGKRAELRYAITGLPVGGFSGTLTGRYGRGGTARGGAGNVRAKTGTLSGVSTLAGVAHTSDGGLLAFAFMADRAPSVEGAEPALDRLAATLATCGCR